MLFNLLDEKWISVLWNNGTVSRVGIKEALTQAHKIRQIAASNPMDRVAVIRFLLALLYWCKGNPPADADIVSGKSFPADWFSKLDDNKDCFNLLGEGKRFYQDKGAERKRAITDLLQEIPTGNNFWHFRHSTDGKNGLCLSCCALGLLRLPLFSVSGLPAMMAGINGKPPIYVLRYGQTLSETLHANWAPTATLGEPTWANPRISPNTNENVPLLVGLTLLSRRVLLHSPLDNNGSCVGCGNNNVQLIITCGFETAGKQENGNWSDPHVIYFKPKKNDRASIKADDLTAAGDFKMDRPWPRLLEHIAKTGNFVSSDGSTMLFIVGFATDNMKNVDVWERTISGLARVPTDEIATTCNQWGYAGHQMEKRIARSEQEGKATIASIRPHVEAGVSAKAGELLAGGNTAWEKAAEKYRPMMKVIASSLSPGFTSAALKRRKEIANTLPDMRPRSEPAKKPAKKKGESK